jgi:uncharacterized protein YecE (DUF72 family)
MAMPRLWAGVSGYAYKEWQGSFYPEKISAEEMLAWYAERLPSVESNSTFYRMPKTSVLAHWAEVAPLAFRFAIKASKACGRGAVPVGARGQHAAAAGGNGALGLRASAAGELQRC